MSEKIGHRDALYLFACHLEWLTKRNLAAYDELLAALGDHEREIRSLAGVLLQRTSPRPLRTEAKLKPVELVAEATNGRRVASQLHSCGQVHKWQL